MRYLRPRVDCKDMDVVEKVDYSYIIQASIPMSLNAGYKGAVVF